MIRARAWHMRRATRLPLLLLLVALLHVATARPVGAALDGSGSGPTSAQRGERLHSLLASSPYDTGHAAAQRVPLSSRRSAGGQADDPVAPSAAETPAHSASPHPHDVLLRVGTLRVDRQLQQAHVASMHTATTSRGREAGQANDRAGRSSRTYGRAKDGPRVRDVTLSSGVSMRLELPTQPRYRTTAVDGATTATGTAGAPLPRQWLLHLKAPIPPRVLAALQSLLQPYQLGPYLPHNTYLLCAPEEVALRLKERADDGSSPLQGRVLLVAALPNAAKLQPGLSSVAQAHHDERMRALWAELDKEPTATNISQASFRGSEAMQQQRRSAIAQKISALHVEMRVHLLFPSLSTRAPQGMVANDSSPDASAHLRASFPANRRDSSYMQQLLTDLQERAAQPIHDGPLSSSSSSPSLSFRSSAPSFLLIDSTQFLVRLPRTPPSASNHTRRAQFNAEYGASLDEWVGRLLLSSPLIHFVESHAAPLMRLLNQHARATVQSDGVPSSSTSLGPKGYADPATPLYHIGALAGLHPGSYPGASAYPQSSALGAENGGGETDGTPAGLRGEGQLLTIGDSGIDYDSCFFHDPSHAVPVNAVNSAHRKIHSYITVSLERGGFSPPGDLEGHGTHTAGTMSGAAQSLTDPLPNLARLSRHDGVAPASRMVVFDFADKTDLAGGLIVPLDLYADYLQRSFDLGSRVCSNSWGSSTITPSGGYGTGSADLAGQYDSSALSMDSFVADHPDYLVLMAAGNSGSYGLGSIATPAVAKNVLTVGSHRSTLGAQGSQGNNLAVRIETPLDFATKVGLATSNPAHPNDFLVSAAFAGFGPALGLASLQTLPVCVSNPPHACSMLSLAEECRGGAILVDMSNSCSFASKLLAVQQFGAALMLVVAPPDVTPFPMQVDASSGPSSQYTIPAAMVTAEFGEAVENYITFRQLSSPSDSLPPLSLSFPYAYNGADGAFHTGRLSEFSSHGPTADGRIKPDVLAAGESVLSAASTQRLDDYQCASEGSTDALFKGWLEFPGTLALKDGTSMSTPVVAGAAALVRQYFQEGWLLDPATGERRTDLPSPSAALLKAVLIQSGQALLAPQSVRMVDHNNPASSPISADVPLDGPPSFLQGFGRVQLDRVLSFPSSAYPTGLFVDDASSVTQGAVLHYCFAVSAEAARTRPFKATLVWTDPPPSLTSALALVNNLDLIVIRSSTAAADSAAADPTVFVGNGGEGVDSSAPSVPLQWDMLNNVEQVTIPSADAVEAFYSVLVRGTNVADARSGSGMGQKFALVVNGAFTIPASNGGGGGCSMEVFCPNACSGHGQCSVSASGSSEPTGFSGASGETRFDSSAPPSGANGNTGFCACDAGWFGADCGARGLELTPWNSVSIHVTSASWTYLYYDYDPRWDESLVLTAQVHLVDERGARLSSSDPDLYVLLPGEEQSAQRGLSYPTLTHYSDADVGVDPEVDPGARDAWHELDFSSRDLSGRPAGQVVVGVYGYCCGQSTLTLQMRSERRPGAPGPPPPSASSSTGDGSGADGSTGAPGPSSPSFNVSYSSYALSLRLLLPWSSAAGDMDEFKRLLQTQVQRGLGLSSYTYAADDRTSFRRNRVWVQTVRDDTREDGTGMDENQRESASASGAASLSPRFRPLATTSGTLTTLVLLPSAADTPLHSGPGSGSPSIPSELSASNSSLNAVDRMSTDALLLRMVAMLNSDPSAHAKKLLSPSEAFLDGGPLLAAIDVAYPIDLRAVTLSYCSSASSTTDGTGAASVAAWTEGVCPQAGVIPPDGSTGLATADSGSSDPLSLTNIIVIAVVGGVVLLALVAAAVWFCQRRRHKAAGAKKAPSPIPPAVATAAAGVKTAAGAQTAPGQPPIKCVPMPITDAQANTIRPSAQFQAQAPIVLQGDESAQHDGSDGAYAPAVQLAHIAPVLHDPEQPAVRIHLGDESPQSKSTPSASRTQPELMFLRVHSPAARRPSTSGGGSHLAPLGSAQPSPPNRRDPAPVPAPVPASDPSVLAPAPRQRPAHRSYHSADVSSLGVHVSSADGSGRVRRSVHLHPPGSGTSSPNPLRSSLAASSYPSRTPSPGATVSAGSGSSASAADLDEDGSIVITSVVPELSPARRAPGLDPPRSHGATPSVSPAPSPRAAAVPSIPPRVHVSRFPRVPGAPGAVASAVGAAPSPREPMANGSRAPRSSMKDAVF